MKTLTKGLVGTVAAGAMAVSSASPAYARDRDGIDAGDVIAGALIIGGIAAVAAAASNKGDDYRYDDYRYDDYRYGDYRDRDGYRDYDRRGYGYRQNARSAVEECVYAAERKANRRSWRGGAKVTDIRDVDRIGNGFKVMGRIAVNTRGRDWRHGDRYYGDGWNNDYRGWNSKYRGYDSGRFTCKYKHGRVVDVDFHGIRGL